MLNYQQFLQAYDAYLQYAASQQPVQQPTVVQPAQPVQQPTVVQPTQPVQQLTVVQPAQPVQQPTVEVVAGQNPYVSPVEVMTGRFNAMYGGGGVDGGKSGNTGGN